MDTGSLVHRAIEIMLEEGMMAAKHYLLYENDTLPPGVVKQAYTVFDAYGSELISLLGIKQAIYLEEEVNFTLPGTSIRVRGFIDAVVETDKGIMLFDWKVRRKLLDPAAVRLDHQLYLYAYYLLHERGIPLAGAAQVQLKSVKTPAPVMRNAHGQFEVKDKTTLAQVERSAKAYGVQPDEVRHVLGGQIVPITEFIKSVYIDLSKVNQRMKLITRHAQALMNDTDYLPVMKAYTCSNCPYVNLCDVAT